MYCSKCGAQNREDADKCVICGTALMKPPPEPATPAEPAATAPGAPPPPPSAPAAPPTAESAPAQVPTMESPPNYLVWAILSTLFCCWPTGIVAIVFAAGVSSKMTAGDIDGARKSSQNAKLWTWITFGLGLAGFVLVFVFALIGAASGY
jgi:hypothetical protein